jgi:ribosomal-protein-alanine N-acetyltransferase
MTAAPRRHGVCPGSEGSFAGESPFDETPRLTVRPLETSDASALADLYTDPEVMHHLGGVRDREVVRRVFEEIAGAPDDDAERIGSLVERSTGAVLGCCGLVRKEIAGRLEYELTYTRAKHRWGRGIATEAVRAVAAHATSALAKPRLAALIEPANEPSARVALRAGFRYAGPVARPGERVLHLYVHDRRPLRARLRADGRSPDTSRSNRGGIGYCGRWHSS